MEFDALAIAVAVLYLTSIALIVMTVVRGSVRTRRERARARVIERLRDPVEACVLEGEPLPLVPPGELDALLELVLRYTSVVRGRDAERLSDCLAEQGVMADLLQRLRARPAWRRAEAAEMLGRLRLRAAVPSLVAALDDPSEDVRTVPSRAPSPTPRDGRFRWWRRTSWRWGRPQSHRCSTCSAATNTTCAPPRCRSSARSATRRPRRR